MDESPYNVLFLCTGNSARSIFGEAIVNSVGKGRFRGFSAGSDPVGQVHPQALALLEKMGIATAGLSSKGWEAFAGPDAPRMDFVFTVCDRAATEPCPIWPGQPMTAHWGVEDPAAITGDEEAQTKAFRDAFMVLRNRIRLFMDLPMASLDRLRLQGELDAIGTNDPETSR